MVEVGGKLVEQFAQNLRQLITDDGAAGGNAAATATEAADGGERGPSHGRGGRRAEAGHDADGRAAPSRRPGPRRGRHADANGAARCGQRRLHQPGQAGGPAILKRVIPVVIALGGLALLGRRLFRRGARGG